MNKPQEGELLQLSQDIQRWARELGFSDCAITDAELGHHETHLFKWLDNDYHGDMHYMESHGTKRSRPAELEAGTLSIVSVRLDYLNETSKSCLDTLDNSEYAYISRYALGRDYHKLIRKRLQKLAKKIQDVIGEFGYRAFTDSAPVLERALAEKAGLGWIGKHSNLLTRESGSWFFLGELYTNLALPQVRAKENGHCGDCRSCIDKCPTQAIVAPYKVDARRCISYLTIELKGSIPIEFRQAIGNRIYGCDDCQLYCPWTRFTADAPDSDFNTRHNLDQSTLLSLFAWDEQLFLKNTEGSPIRRIGHEQWQRNIAIALGNAPTSRKLIEALTEKLGTATSLVQEHITWALGQHNEKSHLYRGDQL